MFTSVTQILSPTTRGFEKFHAFLNISGFYRTLDPKPTGTILSQQIKWKVELCYSLKDWTLYLHCFSLIHIHYYCTIKWHCREQFIFCFLLSNLSHTYPFHIKLLWKKSFIIRIENIIPFLNIIISLLGTIFSFFDPCYMLDSN